MVTPTPLFKERFAYMAQKYYELNSGNRVSCRTRGLTAYNNFSIQMEKERYEIINPVLFDETVRKARKKMYYIYRQMQKYKRNRIMQLHYLDMFIKMFHEYEWGTAFRGFPPLRTAITIGA